MVNKICNNSDSGNSPLNQADTGSVYSTDPKQTQLTRAFRPGVDPFDDANKL
ncbi:hypothetical protein NIES39_O05320 [Arthrospira platensis NIES-39]|nr:hypothetical protein NIES39_O05320 [Arthrospira platensis NIES-39]